MGEILFFVPPVLRQVLLGGFGDGLRYERGEGKESHSTKNLLVLWVKEQKSWDTTYQ